MDIQIDLEQAGQRQLTALFTFVARDVLTNQAHLVTPLAPRTKPDQERFCERQRAAQQRRAARQAAAGGGTGGSGGQLHRALHSCAPRPLKALSSLGLSSCQAVLAAPTAFAAHVAMLSSQTTARNSLPQCGQRQSAGRSSCWQPPRTSKTCRRWLVRCPAGRCCCRCRCCCCFSGRPLHCKVHDAWYGGWDDEPTLNPSHGPPLPNPLFPCSTQHPADERGQPLKHLCVPAPEPKRARPRVWGLPHAVSWLVGQAGGQQ